MSERNPAWIPGRVFLDDCDRRVSGAVGNHDDVQPIGRIGEREAVFNPIADTRGLIPGTNQHGDCRRCRCATHRAWPDMPERPHEPRVTHICVTYETECDPKDRFCEGHRYDSGRITEEG